MKRLPPRKSIRVRKVKRHHFIASKRVCLKNIAPPTLGRQNTTAKDYLSLRFSKEARTKLHQPAWQKNPWTNLERKDSKEGNGERDH